jgi:phosphoglycerate-specific signal transduction histidine kinase
MNIQQKMYLVCFSLWKSSAQWLEKNISKEFSFVEELYWSIMFRINFVLANESSSLMNDRDFCIRCKYAAFNNLRKSISRYLAIENQISDDCRNRLNLIYTAVNDLCIEINEKHPKNEHEHEHLKNVMRNEIPHDDRMLLESYYKNGFIDDEDDDDVII